MIKSINIANLSLPPYKEFSELQSKNSETNKYKCSKCKQLIVYAHQADDCGCKFCFECLDQMSVFIFFSLIFIIFGAPQSARVLYALVKKTWEISSLIFFIMSLNLIW